MLCVAANCELRTVTVSDAGSDGGLDPNWFHPDGLHSSWEKTSTANGASNGAAASNGVAA